MCSYTLDYWIKKKKNTYQKYSTNIWLYITGGERDEPTNFCFYCYHACKCYLYTEKKKQSSEFGLILFMSSIFWNIFQNVNIYFDRSVKCSLSFESVNHKSNHSRASNYDISLTYMFFPVHIVHIRLCIYISESFPSKDSTLCAQNCASH